MWCFELAVFRNSMDAWADHVVTAVGSFTAIVVSQAFLPDVLATLVVEQLDTRSPNTVVVLMLFLWGHHCKNLSITIGVIQMYSPGTPLHPHRQCLEGGRCTCTHRPAHSCCDDLKRWKTCAMEMEKRRNSNGITIVGRISTQHLYLILTFKR